MCSEVLRMDAFQEKPLDQSADWDKCGWRRASTVPQSRADDRDVCGAAPSGRWTKPGFYPLLYQQRGAKTSKYDVIGP